MKAVILAAGYATRMYPLTLNFPKPLLPVGGKSIIDWLYDDIRASGIDDIFIVTNHKFYPEFLAWSADRKGVRVFDDGTESNETRLGALRDIEYVIASARIDDDIFVLAGDNVLDFSFSSFLSYVKEKKTSCIMRHYQEDKESSDEREYAPSTAATVYSRWRRSRKILSRTGPFLPSTITKERIFLF